MPWTTVVLCLLMAGVVVGAVFMRRAALSREVLGSEADRATHRALHIVSQAAPLLRGDLATQGDKAAGHLRTLLGASAVSLSTPEIVLGWDGPFEHHHATIAPELVAQAYSSAEPGKRPVYLAGPKEFECAEPRCGLKFAIVAQLDQPQNTKLTPTSANDPAAASRRALVAFTEISPSSRMLRAVEETARFVASQFELAALDAAQTALAQAEITALRAQISPHFIYNSLNAIASYTRTDPEHARELLLDFADFTRYSFRKRDHDTTLAEELAAVEQYLALEQARFGERLTISLEVAPEVLGVRMPYLCLQPIVENAVKHGIERRAGHGRIAIAAQSVGPEVVITIEDDGVGMEPEHAAAALAGTVGESIGIANVDQRLFANFGHGLDVETGPDAGTKVSLRIPKFAAVNP